jgi:acyl-CoA thioester hydrolase
MPEPDAWPFRGALRVRYQEVDMQRVVFNAHYLAWCDVVCARWFEDALGWKGTADEVDWMVVHAEVDWQGSATYGDTVDIDCGIARWGRSSFDIAYRGTVEGAAVFTALVTSVCVVPGTKDTTPVPELLRCSLGMVPGASPA